MAEVLENIALHHSKSLIEKSRRGNERAYGKLVGLWFKRIYNFCLKYYADHDLAMEMTQQTFITVYQKIDKLKDADSFKFWLYKIALNHCREEDRKQKRRKWYSIFVRHDAAEVESVIGLPEAEYQHRERVELIAGLLAKLPEEQKAIVIMKEFEGMKFREISESLNISENTAKSRLYYGLKALRKELEHSEIKYEIDS